MNDLYDIITALRLKHGISLRQLAIEAKIPPTTLASMMSRRPATIDKEVLLRLAIVFKMPWTELLNKSQSYAHEVELQDRIPAAMSPADIKAVREKLIDSQRTDIRPKEEVLIHALSHSPVHPASAEEDTFRRSFMFVIDQLNDAGLMVAMRRVLEVAEEPRYRKKNKEDTLCHEVEPQTAQDCNPENAQTDDGNAVSRSE